MLSLNLLAHYIFAFKGVTNKVTSEYICIYIDPPQYLNSTIDNWKVLAARQFNLNSWSNPQYTF